MTSANHFTSLGLSFPLCEPLLGWIRPMPDPTPSYTPSSFQMLFLSSLNKSPKTTKDRYGGMRKLKPREAELWLKLRPQPKGRTWAADHCTILSSWGSGSHLKEIKERIFWQEMSIRHVNKTERPTLQSCTHWSHLHVVNFWVWACHHIGKLLGTGRVFKGNRRVEGPDSTIFILQL